MCLGLFYLRDHHDALKNNIVTPNEASQPWKKKHNYAAPTVSLERWGFFMWLFRQILRRNEMTGIPQIGAGRCGKDEDSHRPAWVGASAGVPPANASAAFNTLSMRGPETRSFSVAWLRKAAIAA